MGVRQELGEVVFDKKENIKLFKKEGIVNGDYVYGPDIQGVYFKGGVILDLEDDVQLRAKDEWSDVTLRESVAKSSLVRCRQISSSNFFTKGKLNELGLFIKETPEVNVVFINSSLTAI